MRFSPNDDASGEVPVNPRLHCVGILASTLLQLRIHMVPTLDSSETIAAEPKVSDEAFREPVSSLTDELARISAEIQSINSGFQTQLNAALRETHRQIREEMQQEFEKELEKELEKRMPRIKEIHLEMDRAMAALETVSKEIDGLLDDHGTDLSQIIRKKAIQAELKAYLDGLKFAISSD
jgi:hypothetical protein